MEQWGGTKNTGEGAWLALRGTEEQAVWERAAIKGEIILKIKGDEKQVKCRSRDRYAK